MIEPSLLTSPENRARAVTTQTLHIQLLGTFDIRYGATPLAGAYPARLQSLLAYLVLHRESPQPRQHLAFLFWPDSADAQARTNLRNLLFRLREALPDGDCFLHVDGPTVQWQPDAPFTLDVADWHLALAQAEQAERTADQATARDALERATALYQGDLLPDCFDDWILPQRQELRQAFLDVLLRLIALLEAEQDHDAAIECAQRLLRHDPLHEPGYRALMRLHALSGNRAGALHVYDSCATLLQRELDVEPGPETTRLYERIRDGADLHSPSPTPAHNLPAELTPFVGRKPLLNKIIVHLQDPGCRLLTLVGPGGSGKTRLARQAARAFLSKGADSLFVDGLFFVPLAPLRSSESVVPTIASAIGFSFYEGGTPKQQLLDYLRHKRTLIVLDNLEHLLARPPSSQGERRDRVSAPRGASAPPSSTAKVASLVLELLHAASGVKILVTSRARLNVRGEHLLPIEGMHYPETLPETASELDQYSAVQLFLTSAREVRPDFQPTTDEVQHVIHICRLVEGMPLALLLAAAWMELLTPAEIAHELENKVAQAIDFLATDWRAVPERQRSMRAVFDYSWDLLTEREQKVLQRLSVFRGGFARQAAEQVADASLRDLMTLINRSLLHRTHTGRYEIHELLRQYAAERLKETPGATQAVRDRHSVFYAVALQQWGEDLKGPRWQAALAEMDVEIDNARAAWGCAAERGQVAHLDSAMEGLHWFYWFRCRYQEGEVAFCEAAERLTAMGERSAGAGPSRAFATVVRVLISTLSWQSDFHRLLGHQGRARQLLERARALLETPDLAGQDVRRERALILWEMGLLEQYHSLDRVVRMHEQSLSLFQEMGDRWWVGASLRVLGDLYSRLGQYDKGRQAIEESRAIYQALGSPYWSARGAHYLALSHLRQGQVEQAERWARECLSTWRELGLRLGTGEALVVLSLALLHTGSYLEVQSLMEECLAIGADRGIRSPWPFTILGAAELHLGHYEPARTLVAEGLAIAKDRKINPLEITYSLDVSGMVTLVEGAHTEARQWLDECTALCREEETQNLLGLNHAYLGYVAREEGAIDQAWHHVCRALQIGTALGDPRPRTTALPLCALLLADRGEAARAVELYALASRHPAVANSRWFEDVVGVHIAAAAASLPPELVAAAQERGRARDLEATVEELLAELGA